MKLHTLAGLLTVLSVFTASTTPRRLLGNSFGAPGNASYEYVVVGAGNAGLPLATRLAEGGHTVALIEAGSFYEIGNGNYSQIPVLAPAFVGKDVDNNSPQIDWSFETVPQNVRFSFFHLTVSQMTDRLVGNVGPIAALSPG